jgi:hypothetical protein
VRDLAIAAWYPDVLARRQVVGELRQESLSGARIPQRHEDSPVDDCPPVAVAYQLALVLALEEFPTQARRSRANTRYRLTLRRWDLPDHRYSVCGLALLGSCSIFRPVV